MVPGKHVPPGGRREDNNQNADRERKGQDRTMKTETDRRGSHKSDCADVQDLFGCFNCFIFTWNESN